MPALSLCFRFRLGLSSPDGLLLHLHGCHSVLGPSGSQLGCRERGDSALFCWSVSPVAAMGPAWGVPFVELRPVGCWRLPPSPLHASAMFPSSWSPRQARVRWPTAQRQRPPFVQCPDSLGGTSTHRCARILLRLKLGRHLSAIHQSTTSSLPLPLLPLSLLPSPARLSWLRWRRPVWRFWLLILPPGPASSCSRFSGHAHALSSLLCIPASRKKDLGVGSLTCCFTRLLTFLWNAVVWMFLVVSPPQASFWISSCAMPQGLGLSLRPSRSCLHSLDDVAGLTALWMYSIFQQEAAKCSFSEHWPL